MRWTRAVLCALTLAMPLALAPDLAAAETKQKPVSTPETKRVARAQMILHLLGLYDGTTNGTLGPQTQAALSDYQKKLGLPVTGALDARTAFALDNPDAVSTCRNQKLAMPDCLDAALRVNGFLGAEHATN